MLKGTKKTLVSIARSIDYRKEAIFVHTCCIRKNWLSAWSVPLLPSISITVILSGMLVPMTSQLNHHSTSFGIEGRTVF
jgi:hypothetical protein